LSVYVGINKEMAAKKEKFGRKKSVSRFSLHDAIRKYKKSFVELSKTPMYTKVRRL
jgi:hypothetical protein